MNSKTLLLCTAVAALCSTGALADSGPTWSGLYAGVEVGVSSDTSKLTCVEEGESCSDGEGVSRFDTSLTSTLAGGYAGYNYRFASTNFLLGVEGNIDAAFGKDSASVAEFSAISDGYQTSSSFYASIRGRAGFLFKENLLGFVTAGWGFTNYKLTNSACPNCNIAEGDMIRGDRSGFVIGGGVEYALDEDTHLRLQYLHTDFGKKSVVYAEDEVRLPSTLSSDQVDLGISWNFGG
jgi:outer membrane immunogenic protein